SFAPRLINFVVQIPRSAEEDALEAAIWYEGRQLGSGYDFLNEVDRAVQALADDGLHHRIRSADVRRKPIHRFKFYGIYYVIRENEIWILAIFHGRRHPRALQERVRQIG